MAAAFFDGILLQLNGENIVTDDGLVLEQAANNYNLLEAMITDEHPTVHIQLTVRTVGIEPEVVTTIVVVVGQNRVARLLHIIIKIGDLVYRTLFAHPSAEQALTYSLRSMGLIVPLDFWSGPLRMQSSMGG